MMTRTNRTARMLTLAAGTALATIGLTGCATQAAPRADLSASRAQVALADGKTDKAVSAAEAAVLADPHNAAYRTMLGAAYMGAGRFLAARTSFDDAMKLGDDTPRTALGYALASIAAGDRASAMQVLTDMRDDIPAADLGLALALAGDPQQGVFVLSNAIRGGENTAKTRQNLAYAMALNGSWAGARIMAAEDVPADQLDARMAQWAELAQSDESASRVAALLGTHAVADPGQPVELALANNPTTQQLAAEAAASALPAADAATAQDVAYAGGELPATGYVPMPTPAAPEETPVLAVAAPAAESQQDFDVAFNADTPSGATPAQMIASAVEFASRPVVQQTPASIAPSSFAPDERRLTIRRHSRPQVAAAALSDTSAAHAGSHLVQLGSFSSEDGARRAWAIYARQFPQLSAFDMVITKAVVRGKTYYRVNAAGLERAEANTMCSSVRRKGQGCFAWAEGRPLPGGIVRETRMAAR
jgi:Flp pilus assembly protein TadD